MDDGKASLESSQKNQLRRLALRGSAFELFGYGMSMTLRLGGNILMSRLLFPKAFGLSAEVGFVLYGLVMLSDVGIRQCVIQSPRGDDVDFLNTAFAMQLIRGLAMTVIGLALAIPVARYWFHEPELEGLIFAASFQQLIMGFNSTALLTLRRHLKLGLVNLLDLGQQVVSLTVMITWASIQPSAWALIAGSLVGASFYAVASHFLPVGYRNRLKWDKASYQELTRFGRWIFGSSSVTFLASQGDRALFGRLLGAVQLGVYQVAAELSGAASAVVERLIGGVLYPVLSKMGRDNDTPALRQIFYKSRLALDLVAQCGLGLLCGVGGWLIELVWDPRYWGAAWMLRILCIRAATSCLAQPVEACIVSMGFPRYGFLRSVIRAASIWVGLPVGYGLAGVPGLLWAVALSEVPALLLLWVVFWRMKMLRIERELLAVFMFLVAFVLAASLKPFLPSWHLPHSH